MRDEACASYTQLLDICSGDASLKDLIGFPKDGAEAKPSPFVLYCSPTRPAIRPLVTRPVLSITRPAVPAPYGRGGDTPRLHALSAIRKRIVRGSGKIPKTIRVMCDE
ncbi:hypothetical protein EVAR_35779_1 [Eumeta japonica]|uniref:Uncharacterized protein n=1 Tax=Eumeta variegata TaxID=151549 RepID=A0A4C1WP08_EUMVA|nr:hypothetical protein EVAR_35779_1 [Eumeta japonica]